MVEDGFNKDEKSELEKKKCFSFCLPLLPTVDTWTISRQAPRSMGFSRQEYWGEWSFPSPGDLPNPGIEHGSAVLQADNLSSEPPEKSQKVTWGT